MTNAWDSIVIGAGGAIRMSHSSGYSSYSSTSSSKGAQYRCWTGFSATQQWPSSAACRESLRICLHRVLSVWSTQATGVYKITTSNDA